MSDSENEDSKVEIIKVEPEIKGRRLKPLKTCEFCDIYKGTKDGLLRHQDQMCERVLVSCGQCGVKIMRGKLLEHQENCGPEIPPPG